MTTETAKPHGFQDSHGHNVELSHLEFSAAANTFAKNLQDLRCESPIELAEGFQMARCSSRSKKRCQGCAELYRGDWRSIAYSGIFNQSREVEGGYRYFLLTLTAPSFGPTHYVPKTWEAHTPGPWQRDGCAACYSATGKTVWHHPERDRQKAGLPANLESYDYEGQTRWNNHSYELWKTFWKRVKRRWEQKHGDESQRLAHFGVKELQSRLAIHFHVVIRFPVETAPGSAHELEELVGGVRSSDSFTEAVYSFGSQCDAQELTSTTSNRYGHLGHAAVVGYVLKALNYTIKDTAAPVPDEVGQVSPHQGEPDSNRRRVYLARLRAAAKTLPCQRCTDYPTEECSAPKHFNYGVPNRPFMKSRNWSFTGRTRVGCKSERVAHAEKAAMMRSRLSVAHVREAETRRRTSALGRHRPSCVRKAGIQLLRPLVARNAEVKAAGAFQRRFRNTPVGAHGEILWKLRNGRHVDLPPLSKPDLSIVSDSDVSEVFVEHLHFDAESEIEFVVSVGSPESTPGSS